MINETINLKEFYPNLNNDSYLTTYCPDNYSEYSTGVKRKALIVIPGGGYAFCSDREAEVVALRFTGYDIASFVLKYSIVPNIKYPNPLEEALAAIAYVRKNATKYHIDENSISVVGFSAGGHLAASASCYYDDKEILNKLGLKEEDTKVNGCILGYPVITVDGHYETIKNVSENGRPDLLDKFSIEKHVTSKFPKTFFYHTSDDNVVDVKNSLILASELHKCNVPFEMHVYPFGPHGSSVSDKSVYYRENKEFLEALEPNTDWVKLAIDFIKRYI